MAAFAPWVVLEDSPAIVIAARGYLWNINGTGQSLISEPFPAALSAVEPQKGSVSFDRSNLCKDFRTVIPMSKHSPLLERCPSCTKNKQTLSSDFIKSVMNGEWHQWPWKLCDWSDDPIANSFNFSDYQKVVNDLITWYHFQYLFIWSTGLNCWHSTKLSARHRAMLVSSVHCIKLYNHSWNQRLCEINPVPLLGIGCLGNCLVQTTPFSLFKCLWNLMFWYPH